MTTTKDRNVTLIRAHLYGDSGIGKTTSLSTLPPDVTLVAAAERGLLPLRKADFKVALIESWDDVRDLSRRMMDPVVLAEEAGLKEIRVLAIDSLTEFSEMCKRQIVEVDRRRLMDDRASMKGKEQKLGIYDDLMGMEDWNLYQTRMKQMISMFVHLPVHVVFTGLSQVSENKKTGETKTTPAIHGQLAFTIPALFDLVLHMESIDQPDGNGGTTNARVWKTYNDGNVICKDASGALAPFERADWSALFKKILNGKEGAK